MLGGALLFAVRKSILAQRSGLPGLGPAKTGATNDWLPSGARSQGVAVGGFVRRLASSPLSRLWQIMGLEGPGLA